MKNFLDFLNKNKYIIICVALVVLLYITGIFEFVTKLVVLFALIIGAVYLGKLLQENESFIKKIFKSKKEDNNDNVYYYQDKNDK